MPLSFDIFNDDAFSLVEMTNAINRIEHKPQLLGRMPDLFEDKPIRTTIITLEEKDQVLSLIPTSPRGAPLTEATQEKRKLHHIATTRIAKGSTITADELQNVRAFGTKDQFAEVQAEIAERLAARLDDMELTWENMRLGAISGKILDADGSELVDWHKFWGGSEATELDFDLDNATPADGALLKKCDTVVTQMRKAAKGAWVSGTRCMALCGHAFWSDLIAHPEIAKLRELQTLYGDQTGLSQILGVSGNEILPFGGITFMRYWGTDDNSVSIHTDKARFFPLGARDVFQIAWSPMENFTYANTKGKRVYSMIVRDQERNMWARPEVYSYPLAMCLNPAMLQRAKRT